MWMIVHYSRKTGEKLFARRILVYRSKSLNLFAKPLKHHHASTENAININLNLDGIEEWNFFPRTQCAYVAHFSLIIFPPYTREQHSLFSCCSLIRLWCESSNIVDGVPRVPIHLFLSQEKLKVISEKCEKHFLPPFTKWKTRFSHFSLAWCKKETTALVYRLSPHPEGSKNW